MITDKNGIVTALRCQPIVTVLIGLAENSLVAVINLIVAGSTRFIVTTAGLGTKLDIIL